MNERSREKTHSGWADHIKSMDDPAQAFIKNRRPSTTSSCSTLVRGAWRAASALRFLRNWVKTIRIEPPEEILCGPISPGGMVNRDTVLPTCRKAEQYHVTLNLETQEGRRS